MESIESEKESEEAAAELLTGRMVKNKGRRKITWLGTGEPGEGKPHRGVQGHVETNSWGPRTRCGSGWQLIHTLARLQGVLWPCGQC